MFLVKFANKIVDLFTTLLLVGLVIYAGYSLWDVWSLSKEASLNNDLKIYKPDIEEDKPSFEELLSINEDVIGWISIEGTNIDYPILHGEDNNEYINKNVYGDFSLPGSIFLDFRNTADFKDNYSIVYGHNMYPDSMFGCLDKFLSKDFLEENNKGLLITLDEKYDIEWLMCFMADAYDSILYRPLVKTDNEELLERLYEEDDSIGTLDWYNNSKRDKLKLVVLSTCSDHETNGRVLLVGRILER